MSLSVPTMNEINARLDSNCPTHGKKPLEHEDDELMEDLGLELLLVNFDEQAKTTKNPETEEIIPLDEETFEKLRKLKAFSDNIKKEAEKV